MKVLANITGYIAASLLVITAIFKINYLPGGNVVMITAGIFLSIYFPVFIVNKMADSSAGRTLPLHYFLGLSVSLINLGIVFRLQHWNGAGVLFIAGFAAFSFIYLPMLLIQMLKPQNNGRLRMVYISGFAGAFALSQGILFKIMHLPAGLELMICGAILLFAATFPLYLSEKSRNPDDKYLRLRDLFFVIIMGSMLLIFFMRNVVNAAVHT